MQNITSSLQKNIISFLVVGGVIVAGTYFLLQSDGQRNLSGNFNEGVHFLVESEEGVWYGVREFSKGDFVPMLAEFEGGVVDYARRGDVEALIRDDAGTHVVQVREGEGEWHKISSSPYEKSHLSISPSGEYVAYAERGNKDIDSTEIASWNIEVFTVKTKDLRTIDIGYAPTFVAFSDKENPRDVLVFTTLEGIVFADSVSEEGFRADLLPLLAGAQIEAAHISPDSTRLLKYDLISEEFILFEILSQFPLEISVIDAFPGSLFIGMTNTVVAVENEGEIYTYDAVTGKQNNFQFPKDSIKIISLQN